jgi:hypothetical protein
MRASSNRDLLAACLWASLAVVAVYATDSALPRTVLCAPLVIGIGGHTLLRGLGISAGSTADHIVYAIGASLVVGIAGGLTLNAVGLLSPFGWVAWFWIVVLGSSVAAVRRDTARLRSEAQPWTALSGFRPWHAGAIAVGVLVATGAYAMAVHDEAAQRQFKYTEFWLLPAADGGRLSVGMRSGEEKDRRFDVEVVVDGSPFASYRGVSLIPGQTWAKDFPLSPSATRRRAEARLYLWDEKRVYRSASVLLIGH